MYSPLLPLPPPLRSCYPLVSSPSTPSTPILLHGSRIYPIGPGFRSQLDPRRKSPHFFSQNGRSGSCSLNSRRLAFPKRLTHHSCSTLTYQTSEPQTGFNSISSPWLRARSKITIPSLSRPHNRQSTCGAHHCLLQRLNVLRVGPPSPPPPQTYPPQSAHPAPYQTASR